MDRPLSVAFGNSRNATKWSNKQKTFAEICDMFAVTKRTSETVAEYQKMSKDKKGEIKDVGGLTCCHLRGGRRKRQNVVSLSMVKLDGDEIKPDFLAEFETTNKYECVVYSTHSHTSESPRLRLFFPATKDMTPDEANAVGRYVAAELGIDQFDPCSYLPHQLMYYPSTPSDGEYIFKHFNGDWLDPGEILAEHPNWRDCALLPTSSKESAATKYTGKKQEDPLAKSGVVGAFCKAYPIEDAIEEFLSDVYEPTTTPGRYTYVKGETSGGLVLYEGKFAYSHHATDPACGKDCNAFDLIRVHRFADLDDKAGFKAMSEFVVNDDRVKALLLEERRQSAGLDFADDEDWAKGLTREKSGVLQNTLHNATLILQYEPNLKAIVFNQLADGLEIKGEVPWKHPARYWRDADDAQLISYIDANYGTFSDRNYQIAITKVADDRSCHPIREYLASLPSWDQTPRVDTLLIDCFGSEDTPYVRAVTRKTLCAAIRRVHSPGLKFDTILVLNGPQGVGKSTLIAKLGGDWYSDSLSLTDMNDKTAAEKLQGFWLLEIGELAGMKKADIDKVKAFISRQDDKYRASFGRRVTPHPRQCVFFGTTNSEKGYLRDVTGNRRFWTVKTPVKGTKPSWQLTEYDVRQIWAEALEYVEAGEQLYLDADLEGLAKFEQREAMEQDEREGLVRAYLDRLLPTDWDERNVYKRREFISEPDDPTQPKGVVLRQTVSNIEIWCECFGKHKEDLQPKDSYAIASIMERIETWDKSGKLVTLPIYGRQRIYINENRIKKLAKK